LQRKFTESEIFLSASPEQKILWEFICLRFGETIAVSKYFYCGLHTAGIRLNTYVAGRLFVAYSFYCNYPRIVNTGFDPVTFHDENNVAFLTSDNGTAIYDPVVPAWRVVQLPISIANLYFSRFVWVPNNQHLKFIGFQIMY
jgi:hypothetical protein